MSDWIPGANEGDHLLSQWPEFENVRDRLRQTVGIPPERISMSPERIAAEAEAILDEARALERAWSIDSGLMGRASVCLAALLADRARLIDRLNLAESAFAERIREVRAAEAIECEVCGSYFPRSEMSTHELSHFSPR